MIWSNQVQPDDSAEPDWLRSVCIHLYYKGYHEGKGDAPNSDDVEITKVVEAIQSHLAEEVLKARVDEVRYLQGNQPLGRNIGGNFYYTGLDLDQFFGDRIAELTTNKESEQHGK